MKDGGKLKIGIICPGIVQPTDNGPYNHGDCPKEPDCSAHAYRTIRLLRMLR